MEKLSRKTDVQVAWMHIKYIIVEVIKIGGKSKIFNISFGLVELV